MHVDSAAQLVLVRHGESEWNRTNRFTGWADVGVTDLGLQQMREAGMALKQAGVQCDVVFTSVLTRCLVSTWELLLAMGTPWLPQVADWQLNERHYGGLTGQNKAEAALRYGADMVKTWRRSYDACPPPLEGEANSALIDMRYAGICQARLPRSESLRQTVLRVEEFWHGVLAVQLAMGRRVLVVGHGNSLRALTKIIEGLGDSAIVDVEVSNASPVVYSRAPSGLWKRSLTLQVPPRSPSAVL